MEVTNEEIKAIFLENGFSIKEGLDDLKPYVYKAAWAIVQATINDIYQRSPVAYRYTASGYTKWHYQEKFPSASKRGQIKNCGRIEALFVLPDNPCTPDY